MAPSLRRMVLAIGMAAAAACTPLLESDGGPAEVRMTVDRERYAPGDTVSAAVVNGSETDLGYNFCFATLERQDSSGWVVADEPLMFCTMELRTLPAGESVALRRELPASLEDGRYRLRVAVHFPLAGGSRVALHSDTFEVGR